jgi:hypothetical protein
MQVDGKKEKNFCQNMCLYVYVNLEEVYAHAGGRQEREELLPESVLLGQTVLGPQDAVL